MPNSCVHEKEHVLACEEAQKTVQRSHLVYWYALPVPFSTMHLLHLFLRFLYDRNMQEFYTQRIHCDRARPCYCVKIGKSDTELAQMQSVWLQNFEKCVFQFAPGFVTPGLSSWKCEASKRFGTEDLQPCVLIGRLCVLVCTAFINISLAIIQDTIQETGLLC